ncbi:MAG: AraC family transcriptional regulator, partial [Mucilaginibacter sp.]|nr:AraC family transcriptional regulator [Mucilaginibacter sp.]
MVSNRCKIIVQIELEKLGLHYIAVMLGRAEVLSISSAQIEKLNIALLQSGLELMDDKKSILIEKIKNVIIE